MRPRICEISCAPTMLNVVSYFNNMFVHSCPLSLSFCSFQHHYMIGNRFASSFGGESLKVRMQPQRQNCVVNPSKTNKIAIVSNHLNILETHERMLRLIVGRFWRIPIRVFVVLTYTWVFGVYAISCVFNHVSSKKMRICLAYTHPHVFITGHYIHNPTLDRGNKNFS